MTYPFTQTELDELETIRSSASSSGDYSDVYKYILFHTSTFSPSISSYNEVTLENLENASPISGVENSVWLWARGAFGVNSDDDSFFSDFIRDYTAAQHSQRYGVSVGSSEVDQRSDEIADAFASDIINNFLSTGMPALNTIGEIDAGRVASGIFNPTEISSVDYTANYSPWAGTLLFSFLGQGYNASNPSDVSQTFLSQWVLQTGTVQNSGTAYYKALEGTYDLISIAAASREVTNLFDAWWESDRLEETIASNSIGETATLQLLSDLRDAADTFFQSVYAVDDIEQFRIGGDLTLYGDTKLSSLAAYLNAPDYIVGTLDNDVSVLGTGGEDVVHAGLGSDVIYGSEGSDIIDGGRTADSNGDDSDTDTLDYSNLSNIDNTGITINFETITSLNNYFDHRIVVTDPGFVFGGFTDYAYDIEKLVLTNADDTVVSNQNILKNYEIDGGQGDDIISAGAGNDILVGGDDNDFLDGGDGKLDVARYDGGVLIELSDNANYEYKATDSSAGTDYLKEIEIIEGTKASGNDEANLVNSLTTDHKIDLRGDTVRYNYKLDGDDKSIDLKYFDTLTFSDQDDYINVTGGVGNITIDGGGIGDNDTVHLGYTGADYTQAFAHWSGEGLYVSDTSIYSTLDGTKYINIETFANVNYAHITALGHTYEGDDADYWTSGMSLDYSDFSEALTFDLSAGSVFRTNNAGALADSINSDHLVTFVGTNYGDTVRVSTSNYYITHFYSGLGDDTLYENGLPISVVGDYFYTGGNDVVGNVSRINISENFVLSESMIQTSGEDVVINLSAGNSITIKVFPGNTSFRVTGYDASGNRTSVVLEHIYSNPITKQTEQWSFFDRPTSERDVINPSDDGDYAGGRKIVTGAQGNDDIWGDANKSKADQLYGNAGDDKLYGLTGDDFLYGGNAHASAGTDNDTLDGGDGIDHASYVYNTSAVYVDLSITGSANADDTYDGTTATHNDTLINIENVTGSYFDDVLIGDSGDNELHGMHGDDQLTGGGGADKFFVGSGHDTITDFKATEGDKISIEFPEADLSKIEIIYRDGNIAEIYKTATNEKIATVHIGDTTTDISSALEFDSYTPAPPQAGNNTPTVTPGTDPQTGDDTVAIELPDNSNTKHGFYTVIPTTNGLQSTLTALASYLPAEHIDAIEWAYGPGEDTLIIRYGSKLGLVNVQTDYITLWEISDDPYGTLIFNSNADDGNDGSSFSVQMGTPGRGHGNDDVFIVDAPDPAATGNFTITEDVNAGYDRLIINGASINDVYMTTSSYNLVINFYDSAYTYTITGNNVSGYGSDVAARIDVIEFSEGGTIDLSSGLHLQGHSTNVDTFDGSFKDDEILGYGGNDTLNGLAGNDALTGGLGDDTLAGGIGNDSYVWSVGDGNDLINETGGNDQLVLHGVIADDIRFEAYQNFDIRVHINGNEYIEINNQFRSDYYQDTGYDHRQVESILLDDSTVIDLNDDIEFVGTSLNDTLTAFNLRGTVLQGLGGNDTLNGKTHDDTFVWSVGDGNDQINETGGTADQLVLHGVIADDIRFEWYSTSDLRVHIGAESIEINKQFYSDYQSNTAYDIYQIESILLDDSTVINLNDDIEFVGTSFADTLSAFNLRGTVLQGLGGNDTLNGKTHDDTFVWSVGDGNDQINETGGTADQLVLHGVIADDIRFEWYSTSDLRVHIGAESIEINKQFYSDYQSNTAYDIYQIESILLDDSTVIDLNDDIEFVGTSFADTLSAFNLRGTILQGLGGNDTLNGKTHNDTFVWSVGDGNDTINETGGTADQLVLHGVIADDIRFEWYSTSDLRVHIGAESIEINKQFYSDYQSNTAYDIYQIESILLDDSTVIDLNDDIEFVGTSLADALSAFNLRGTVLQGLGGNDTLNGKTHNDTFVWSVGDGNDTITETGGTDQLVLHGVIADDIRFEHYSTYDLRVHIGSEYITIKNQFRSDVTQNPSYDGDQVESVLLDDSSTIDLLNNLTFTGTSAAENVYGLSDDNVLIGLGGDDYYYGYAGNDTYIWNTGDGNDTIYDDAGTVDTILLGAGIIAEDIRLWNVNNGNLEVHIGSEKITINDHFDGTGEAVESLTFSDSSTFDLLNDLTFEGTSTTDTVHGLADNNTLIGNTGADTLNGYAGNDTYIWNTGDGNDWIYDSAGTADTIQFGAGITAEDIRLWNLNNGNLEVHIGSEKITINDHFDGTGEEIESIIFDDTSAIDLTGVLTFAGTSSADTVYGTTDSDVLYGLEGADNLYGQGGGDVFAYNAADIGASDTIYNFSTANGDAIDISDVLEGYDPLSDAISDFVNVTTDGTHSYVHVDADGGADNFVQVAQLYQVASLDDADTLETNGNLLTV